MKNLISSLIVLCGLQAAAQTPVIEGTYLPVAGTNIHHVYDTTNGSLAVPSFGPNQTWNYATQFTNICDTGSIETYYKQGTPYAANHPDATHATFLRTVFQDGDSLWSYLKIDTSGVWGVGDEVHKTDMSLSFESEITELMMPQEVQVGDVYYDTSRRVGYGTYFGLNVMVTQTMYKRMEEKGYGSLTTPIGTFNDVILGVETRHSFDSVFVDLFGTGNYQLTGAITPNPLITYERRYHFLRNNTFGSTHLMQMAGDTLGNQIRWGWYSLPVSIGSIQGTIYDSTGLACTNADVLLYRENSNFAKNDILAQTTVDASGNYQFDSIPYGEYRIAARADQGAYPQSLTTYVGDTTNWIDCQSIFTSGAMYTGADITLQYHPTGSGSSQAAGNIYQNLSFTRANDPIPGIDVIIRRNPSGEVQNGSISNGGGSYDFSSLDDGSYTVFVDIPGLHMAGSYDVNVSGGAVMGGLDFIVGLDSIYPVSWVQSTPDIIVDDLQVKSYPNPFNEVCNVAFDLDESAVVKVEVLDLQGRVLQERFNGRLNKGKYVETIEAADLDSDGIYFVRIWVDETPTTVRLIKR